jgi:3-hydroxybutyryl-CoA dehydrogenase
MGTGIAIALARAGLDVRLHDVDPAQLTSSLAYVADGRWGLRRAAAAGKIQPDEAERAIARVTATTDLARACGDAELVIEAVPEDLALKISVFRELDRHAPPETILASNTAGFSIGALAAATDRPDRVIGWHWFQPAPVMRLAEIVVHPGTSDEVWSTVCSLAERCDKEPVVVRDHPEAWGFVANRLFSTMKREAERIVAEGIASRDDVDRIMRLGFNWPRGIFEEIPR